MKTNLGGKNEYWLLVLPAERGYRHMCVMSYVYTYICKYSMCILLYVFKHKSMLFFQL